MLHQRLVLLCYSYANASRLLITPGMLTFLTNPDIWHVSCTSMQSLGPFEGSTKCLPSAIPCTVRNLTIKSRLFMQLCGVVMCQLRQCFQIAYNPRNGHFSQQPWCLTCVLHQHAKFGAVWRYKTILPSAYSRTVTKANNQVRVYHAVVWCYYVAVTPMLPDCL